MLDGIKKVHFIGIGGYGMSALAYVLLESGFEVTGSDLKSSTLTENLRQAGAAVYIGHKAEQIGEAQLVVYSTAIPPHNPELEEARRGAIPLWHRSELLAAIINERYGIAIAGTHGKTTSTAMVSLLLEHGGYDPTAFIGGEVSFLSGNARVGKSDYVVAEACESDYSFLRYQPRAAIVTNVEPDHLEFYGGDFHRLVEAYRGFLSNVKGEGPLFLCAEDPILNEIKDTLDRPVLTYGFSADSDIRGERVCIEGLGSSFCIVARGHTLGEVQLRVPGTHNVLNALSAAAMALELGVDFSCVREALYEFRGVKRRFERIGEGRNIMVVDDYGHHPTEIRVTLEAARGSSRRIICVFQPHRYSRTKFLWDEFKAAFDEADVLVLTPVYSAGEEPLPGISSEKLAEKIHSGTSQQVYYRPNFDAVINLLDEVVAPGDLVLTMGAGDVWKIGQEFSKRISSPV